MKPIVGYPQRDYINLRGLKKSLTRVEKSEKPTLPNNKRRSVGSKILLSKQQSKLNRQSEDSRKHLINLIV